MTRERSPTITAGSLSRRPSTPVSSRPLNGVPYASAAADLDNYPKLDGIPVPLARMRSVVRDSPCRRSMRTLGEPIDQFSEQERKAKLVLAPAARTYGDWSAADRQPVVTAKFSEPGYYNSKDPVRFDLAWLGRPAEAYWRWVRSAGFSDEFPEIELRYGNGYRLVLADARLAGMPARGAKPGDEADLLHLTFGIGTPEIYANVDERIRELETERPAYLFLLDAKGKSSSTTITPASTGSTSGARPAPPTASISTWSATRGSPSSAI